MNSDNHFTKLEVSVRKMKMKIHTRWIMVLTTLLLIILNTPVITGHAKSQEDLFDLDIVAANCKRMPTAFPFLGGNCVPSEDTVIVVTTSEDELIGTCIAKSINPTDAVAGCSVPVPFGSSVVVTEDITTLPSGYIPTQNPQLFDLPISPPDGVFGGPVFLNLPIGSADAISDEAITVAPDVDFIGEPSWWIVPFASGWGNTEEGHLYFAASVKNPTNTTVHIGVSFRAYESDGTPFPGCQMPGGEGPGVAESIAPGETALIRCSRTIAPTALTGLQITAQLWDVTPLPNSDTTANIRETGFDAVEELSTPMETTYDAFAVVESANSEDVETALRFRFYNDQGIQVGTCDSNTVTIEPEIGQRVGCSFPLILDVASPQPVSIQVETLPASE